MKTTDRTRNKHCPCTFLIWQSGKIVFKTMLFWLSCSHVTNFLTFSIFTFRRKHLLIFVQRTKSKNTLSVVKKPRLYWLQWKLLGVWKTYICEGVEVNTHFERFFRIPVPLKLVLQGLLQFFSENVDSATRKFIVEVRNDKIQRDLNLDVHVYDIVTFRTLGCTLRKVFEIYILHSSVHDESKGLHLFSKWKFVINGFAWHFKWRNELFFCCRWMFLKTQKILIALAMIYRPAKWNEKCMRSKKN